MTAYDSGPITQRQPVASSTDHKRANLLAKTIADETCERDSLKLANGDAIAWCAYHDIEDNLTDEAVTWPCWAAENAAWAIIRNEDTR